MSVKDGEFQQTIKNTVSYTGIGLHSGQEVNINLKPAPADKGIVFRRIDIEETPEIRVEPDSVHSTNRSTSIGISYYQNTIKVGTIEHIMAVFWNFGVDNIVIEIDGPELPIGDGSAYPFIKLLEKAELKQLQSSRQIKVIDNPFWVQGRPGSGEKIVILPASGLKVSYTLDFDHPAIGTQLFEFDSEQDSFVEDIARARTFGFEDELDNLHNKGLARGGSLKNAILISDKEIINSLRYEDELVRHKILDIIGDMALNGFIQGQIIAIKSGHKLQVQLAKKIDSMKNQSS